MVNTENRIRPQPHPKLLLDLRLRKQTLSAKMIQRQAPAERDPPWLFSHASYPFCRLASAGKMQVAHLGQRVADGVVNGTERDLAAFDMGNGNPQRQRH